MTPEIMVLIVHLGATQAREKDIPPGMTCQQAGEAWLASLTPRRANDWFECVRRER